MNKDVVDKCLSFAEGNKGNFNILKVRQPDFPESLIKGTETQRAILNYREQGYNVTQIAAKLGCTKPNVTYQMDQYKNRVQFYHEWNEFWDAAENVRNIPVSEAFSDILTEDEMILYKKKRIYTIGDFLRLNVTKRTMRVRDSLFLLSKERNGFLFDRIKEYCYKLIPFSDDTVAECHE